MNVLGLFSGIGGFELGFERAGFNIAAMCECEPYARAVLGKHWPRVPVFPDVRRLTGQALDVLGFPRIDVITGGFPCQDISLAGKGAGLAGERSGLWREYHRLIDEIRPAWVVIENVSALRSRGLDTVLGSLAAIGYDAEWHCIPAGALGSPQERDRLYALAYPAGYRRHAGEDAGQVLSKGPRGQSWWTFVPRANPSSRIRAVPIDGLHPVADGLPERMARLHAAGNAVVPQIPEMIARAILASEAS